MNDWIERQRHLLDFTLTSLARRKTKNIGLLVVFTLLVFILASVSLYTQALRSEAVRVLEQSPEIVVQRLVAGRHDLIPPDYLEGIGRLRGVRSIETRLWGYYYDPVLKANYTLMVPRTRTIEQGEIVVGPALEHTRGLGTNTGISLRAYSGELHTFLVTDVLPHETELMSADLVLMNEDDFRRFFNFPDGHYTDIVLSVANPREVRNVGLKLMEMLPDARPILREEVLRTYNSIYAWREGLLLALLSASILAFGILAWEKSTGLSADERREIGILKAIGWETGDVIRMKFWEGFVIAFSAFLFGYVLAYVHVFYMRFFLFEPVLKGWAVLYPRFALTPQIDAMQLITLFIFTVVPYVAAVLVPIWRAATTDPDTVMRS